MRLPWKREPKKRITPQTPVAQIRYLYADYQKQRSLWLYIVASSLFLIGLWVAFNLFVAIDPWALSLPVSGLIISTLQVYRIKHITTILRSAHAIQQEIAKAEAEKRAAEEEEAAKKEGLTPGGAPLTKPAPGTNGHTTEEGSDDDPAF